MIEGEALALKIAEVTKAIDRHGILLVFPLENRADPPSIWSHLYPRSRMRWDWDEGADPRVVDLWHMRERLARSGNVVYTKWFRGRATFFSRPVFHAILSELAALAARARPPLDADMRAGLPRESVEILELLEESSPQSTKALRAQTDLRGRPLEAVYQRALRALWARLLIVGAGEVDDGAFPSLAIGATHLLFEDIWQQRGEPNAAGARLLQRALDTSPAFAREMKRSRAGIATPATSLQVE